MGFGLLGLLVCVAVGMYIWSLSATTAVNTYNSSQETMERVLEHANQQLSEQTFQANRDPSKAAANTGQSNGNVGVAPISPAAPGIVTPPVGNPPANTPSLNKATEKVPLQMPDRGAGKLMDDM